MTADPHRDEPHRRDNAPDESHESDARAVEDLEDLDAAEDAETVSGGTDRHGPMRTGGLS